jgi:hypothetical protein
VVPVGVFETALTDGALVRTDATSAVEIRFDVDISNFACLTTAKPTTPILTARTSTVAQYGLHPERAMLRQEEDRDWYEQPIAEQWRECRLTISPTAVAHCKVHTQLPRSSAQSNNILTIIF